MRAASPVDDAIPPGPAMDPLLERAQDALSTARAAEAVVLIIAGGLAIASLSIIIWKRWYTAAEGRLAEADAHRAAQRLPALTPSLLFASGLMVWLAGQIGSMAAYGPIVAALPVELAEHEPPPLLHQLLLRMAGGVFELGAVVMLCVFLPQLARTIGMRCRGRDVGAGVVAFALAAPIVWIASVFVMMLFHQLARLGVVAEPQTLAHETLRSVVQEPSAGTRVFAAVVVAGVVPVFEEVIYRGFVQTALLSATRSRWAAILGASALFTLVHVGASAVVGLPVLFLLSVVLGLVYERSRSIAAPIVVHALFNAANLLMALSLH